MLSNEELIESVCKQSGKFDYATELCKKALANNRSSAKVRSMAHCAYRAAIGCLMILA